MPHTTHCFSVLYAWLAFAIVTEKDCRFRIGFPIVIQSHRDSDNVCVEVFRTETGVCHRFLNGWVGIWVGALMGAWVGFGCVGGSTGGWINGWLGMFLEDGAGWAVIFWVGGGDFFGWMGGSIGG